MTLLDLLVRTPAWVYGIGLALLAFGLLQTSTRHVRPAAARAPALILAIVSVTGVVGAFRGNGLVLVGWAAGAGAALALARAAGLWRGVRAEAGRIVLPGSWLPLVLMLAVFALRWATGVALAVQLALAGTLGFALGVAAASGAVSGLFLARGWMVREARAGRRATA